MLWHTIQTDKQQRKQMSFNYDLAEETDKQESSFTKRHNPNIYRKIILEDNKPELISFLTDWLRGMKLDLHFNPAARRMDLCNKMNKKPCEVCAAGEKKNATEDEKRNARPTTLKVFLTYAHSREGLKVPSRDGTKEFMEDVIRTYEQRMGEGKENFTVLMDANGDPYSYYEDMGEGNSPRYVLEPDSLPNNNMMFEGNGDDKIWEIKKIVIGTKTSYPTPQGKEVAVLRKKAGSQAKYRVPKIVRDFFKDKSLADLAPFYLAQFGNVDWSVWGCQPPEEGQKLTLEAAAAPQGVDASKVL